MLYEACHTSEIRSLFRSIPRSVEALIDINSASLLAMALLIVTHRQDKETVSGFSTVPGNEFQ
jgi:hypothetical protein